MKKNNVINVKKYTIKQHEMSMADVILHIGIYAKTVVLF